MLDLLSAEVRRHPFALYARLRAVSPVFRDPRSGVWMILHYAGVRRALYDPGIFSSILSWPAPRAPIGSSLSIRRATPACVNWSCAPSPPV